VVVVERGHYESASVDVLSSETLLQLEDLGLRECFSTIQPTACPAIRSAWGHRDLVDRDFICNPYGPSWSVQRHRLDSMLAKAARQAGAIVVSQARPRSVDRTAAGWRLTTDTPSGPVTVHSELLVDASGPGASIARMLAVRRLVVSSLTAWSP
jgi:flavin-dependent dehydrogenase